VRAAVLGAADAEFDLERLAGERVGPGELADALRALPLFAPRRLVVLRDPEARRGKPGDALAEALEQGVGELADGGPCTLAVVAPALERRSRLVKAFREPAAVVACDPPRSAREAAEFLRDEAKAQGIALEGDAVQLLAESVGPDLLALRQELAKAALFAGAGVRVSAGHVRETLSILAEQPVWDLTDAIGEGRASDALGVLGRLLAGGAPPPVVLASLAGHFRKLLRAKSGEKLAGHPFAVQKLERQARRYPPARLVACLRAIHEVDEVLKGQGALAPELAQPVRGERLQGQSGRLAAQELGDELAGDRGEREAEHRVARGDREVVEARDAADVGQAVGGAGA
jgi:DNA polymerase-3 subunit delta